jgi:hypothetical protein
VLEFRGQGDDPRDGAAGAAEGDGGGGAGGEGDDVDRDGNFGSDAVFGGLGHDGYLNFSAEDALEDEVAVGGRR